MSGFGQLYTRPSRTYPSGKRYAVWKPGNPGIHCQRCGGPMLNHNPAYRYCSDPECQNGRRRQHDATKPKPPPKPRPRRPCASTFCDRPTEGLYCSDPICRALASRKRPSKRNRK